MRLKLLLIALPLLGACIWGTPVSKFPAAQSPSGATVTYVLNGNTSLRSGELFAVDEQHLYVYQGTLYQVAWARIRRVSVDKAGADYTLYAPAEKPTADRLRMAPLSRFPQGLSPDLLAAVLRQLDQPRLEEPQ